MYASVGAVGRSRRRGDQGSAPSDVANNNAIVLRACHIRRRCKAAMFCLCFQSRARLSWLFPCLQNAEADEVHIQEAG